MFPLDDLINAYQRLSFGQLLVYVPWIQRYFLILFTITFTWNVIRWTITDTPNAVALAIRQLIAATIVFAFIRAPYGWLPLYLEGFSFLGGLLNGDQGLSPSGVLDTGISLFFAFHDSVGEVLIQLLPPLGGSRIAVSMGLLMAFVVAAYQMTRVQVEGALAAGALAFNLIWAGSAITWDAFSNYLRYIFELGIRTVTLYALVAVLEDLGRMWTEQLGLFSLLDPRTFFTVAFSLMAFIPILWKVPDAVSSRVAAGVRIPNPFAT